MTHQFILMLEDQLMIKKIGQVNMNSQSIISDGREKDTYFRGGSGNLNNTYK